MGASWAELCVLTKGGCLTLGASEKPNLIACALTEILIQAQQGQPEVISVSPVFLTGADLTKPTYEHPQENITCLHQKSKGRSCGAVDARKAMKEDVEVP